MGMRRRVCLYFGSFNPLHIGHLALARYAVAQLEHDEVWLVLSPVNPHKAPGDQLPYAYRYTLIAEAIADEPQIAVSIIERTLPRPHYTIRTLRALQMLHPEVDFSLLIGADNLAKIQSWYAWRRLVASLPLYVYPRPHYDSPMSPLEASMGQVQICHDAPQIDISSSQIRQAARSGGDARAWLPCPERWASLVYELGLLSSRPASSL